MSIKHRGAMLSCTLALRPTPLSLFMLIISSSSKLPKTCKHSPSHSSCFQVVPKEIMARMRDLKMMQSCNSSKTMALSCSQMMMTMKTLLVCFSSRTRTIGMSTRTTQ